MNFIKLFGLERSGTNYLEWLIRENFLDTKVLVDETGWKHGRIPECVSWDGSDWSDPRWNEDKRRGFVERRRARLGELMPKLMDTVESGEMLYCMIRKNPYSWCASYALYRGKPISPVQPHVIKRWVEYNEHWHSYAVSHPTKTCFFKYEDVLTAPEKCLEVIAARFGLELSETRRLVCEQTISAWGGRPIAQPFDHTYYHEERYLGAYSPDDFETFTENLPVSLLSELGYSINKHSELNRSEDEESFI